MYGTSSMTSVDKEDTMTTWTILLVVIGAATCTSWVFKLVDIIEKS